MAKPVKVMSRIKEEVAAERAQTAKQTTGSSLSAMPLVLDGSAEAMSNAVIRPREVVSQLVGKKGGLPTNKGRMLTLACALGMDVSVLKGVAMTTLTPLVKAAVEKSAVLISIRAERASSVVQAAGSPLSAGLQSPRGASTPCLVPASPSDSASLMGWESVAEPTSPDQPTLQEQPEQDEQDDKPAKKPELKDFGKLWRGTRAATKTISKNNKP